MRISDWSSDVCSSDLADVDAVDDLPWPHLGQLQRGVFRRQRGGVIEEGVDALGIGAHGGQRADRGSVTGRGLGQQRLMGALTGDRKSVVEGKSVAVGVDLGGGRGIKTKNQDEN